MKDSVEKIIHNDSLLAIIIRSSYRSEGIEFFTPGNFSQQLAYMNRPQGYRIPAHVHNKVHRDIFYTLEVLFIKSGKVRVDFYTNDQEYVKSRILEANDILMLVSGGHGFEMIEPTEMVEVKQGPYVENQDKTRFSGVLSKQGIFEEESNDTNSSK